jgi:hypothetical protein
MTTALIIILYGLATYLFAYRHGRRDGKDAADAAWYQQSERKFVVSMTPRALRAAKRMDETCKGK